MSIRLSFRDSYGKELDAADAADGLTAVSTAMQMLSRRDRLNPGELLSVDDGSVAREPAPDIARSVSAGNIRSLAARLDQRADVIAREQPQGADDLRLAALFCRHAIKCGWIITSIALGA